MSELDISRSIFPKGAQRLFVETALAKSTTSELASLCFCTSRTIREWKNEGTTMPAYAVHFIYSRFGIAIPKSVRFIPRYGHTSDAGKKGGAAIIREYGRIPGEPSYRAQKWLEWWNASGKASSTILSKPLPFTAPEHSEMLAECIGIIIGDGGLTNYQLKITLNTIDDAEYIQFVASLLRELFGVEPSLCPRTDKNATDIIISRKLLTEYLHSIGLPIGHKLRSGLDIPEWIKKNSEYSRACLRGLIDTDGCIYSHNYLSKGISYSYKKLSFTSASATLLNSVNELFLELGMHPRITRTRDVRLESKADVKKYFVLINTHNPKHLNRYAS